MRRSLYLYIGLIHNFCGWKREGGHVWAHVHTLRELWELATATDWEFATTYAVLIAVGTQIYASWVAPFSRVFTALQMQKMEAVCAKSSTLPLGANRKIWLLVLTTEYVSYIPSRIPTERIQLFLHLSFTFHWHPLKLTNHENTSITLLEYYVEVKTKKQKQKKTGTLRV